MRFILILHKTLNKYECTTYELADAVAYVPSRHTH